MTCGALLAAVLVGISVVLWSHSLQEQLHETQSLVDVGRLVEAAPEETVKLFQETKRKSISWAQASHLI